MSGIYLRVPLASLVLGLAACGGASHAPPGSNAQGAAAPESLNRVIDRYWQAYLQLNPLAATMSGEHRYDERLGNPISEQYLADSLALERRSLAELATVRVSAGDADAQLNREMLRRELELRIEGFRFPSELLPVNPFDSMPLQFARMASGSGPQAFATEKDYENWLSRAGEYGAWTRQAILNMRAGMRRGYLIAPELVEELLPQLASLAAGGADGVFYQPLHALPASIPDAQKSRLADRCRSVVDTVVLAAYRELHEFLQKEYLPAARAAGPESQRPLADEWYAYQVRWYTGTTLNPAELHALGLAEVDRIRARVQTLLSESGFAGSARDYLDVVRRDPANQFESGSAVLAAYEALKPVAQAAAAMQFPPPPAEDYRFLAVEPFRSARAPAAEYVASPPGGAPAAIFYVNTAAAEPGRAWGRDGLMLKEGVPGRHSQLMLQRNDAALPGFRRYGSQAAFVDGWALYAESMGEDIGFFHELPARFCALLDQWGAAAALVVDTGLHAKGWSRQKAIDFVRTRTALDERDAADLVDRSLAMPGRELAATIGALRFRAMRGAAQQRLAERFDPAAFHAEILKQGAMPLDLVEDHLRRWVPAPPEPSVPPEPHAPP